MFTILGADGKEYGPVTAGKLHEWIAGGRANLQTKARRADETEWKTLGDYPEMSQFGRNSSSVPPIAFVATAPFIATSADDAATPAAESAPLLMRFLAALIDGTLKTLCYLPISLALFHAMMEQAQTGTQLSFVEMARMTTAVVDAKVGEAFPFFTLLLLVQLFLLTRRGQSVGKLLLHLRIVRAPDNSPVGFLRAFLLRGSVPFLIEQIPLLGFAFWVVDSCFIFRHDRRCLHDLLAGTKVIRS